jgi:G3E family GTPase
MSRSTTRPLVILAGFLGAGKTTFLRTVVTELVRRGLRPRIILNDLEDARVDGATLRDLEAELAPVSGGCLCCETQDALIEALRAESESPYDVVLLETNGTTDTAVLLEILSGAEGLDHLGPPLQLTMIDAAKFERRDWMNTIEKEQLRTSSHLKVSKRDLVTPARFEEVCRAVQAVVPAARFAEATDIADTIAGQLGDQPPPPRVRDRPGISIGKTARPQRPHLPHTFLSCQVEIPFPIDPAEMEAFLNRLPEQVQRAKGVLLLREPAGEKRSFQWVSGQGGEVSPCMLEDPDSLAPVAIFVGSGLDVTALRDGLLALR